MEQWSEFFKPAKPRRTESGGITLATTTDSREALDSAAAGRVRRDDEATFTYTEVGPSIVEQDGAIEHSEPTVLTDGPEPEDPAELLEDMLAPMTPEQEAIQTANYQVQLLAARAVIPDFDEVIDQEENIPHDVVDMIRRSGLPNGPLVGYYLGKHRTEMRRLLDMTLKQRQQRIVKISAALSTSPAGVALDTADYPTYRRARQQEIRSRYR